MSAPIDNPVDHRELGRALELFASHPSVGSGLPLWLPDGAVIRAELEKLVAEEAARSGCRPVYTPVLAKRALFEQSGHWDKFHDDMFPPMDVGGEEFVLRPANCPHHTLIYAAKSRSYRDLPVRLSELGAMFRSERSGVLGGLSRVRQANLDDTHVFCTEEQIAAEAILALQQIRRGYAVLGIEIDHYRLSLRDDSDAFLGDPGRWSRAQDRLRAALREFGVEWVEAPGEAAFYGPKIDVQVRDSGERELTLSTVQLDFNQPERFDLSYVAADGSRQRPVMIHRSLLSTMERMVAQLIERHAGAFPPWLAPVQLAVLPVADEHHEAAAAVAEQALAAGLRVDVLAADASLGARIRASHDRRIPYVAVIGAREAASGLVGLRLRDDRRVAPGPVAEMLAEIGRVVRERSLRLGFEPNPADPPAPAAVDPAPEPSVPAGCGLLK